MKNYFSEKAKISLSHLLKPTNELENKNTDIPKIIWIYWNSGFKNAPDVVQRSIESWRNSNPDYQVNLLCDDNLNDYLGFNFYDAFYLSTVHCFPAIKSDLLRLYLLSKYGGIWADATTFCLNPLSNWLDDNSKLCNLFLFKHEENNTRPMEVWFIAAPKASEIICKTLQSLCDHIFKNRSLSLYVTGKLSVTNKAMQNKNIPQDKTTILKAETLGFMPYFSTGYMLYNEANNILTNEQLSILLREDPSKIMINSHALTRDTIEKFNHSFISKQTYSNSYLNSEFYKERVKNINKKEENQC